MQTSKRWTWVLLAALAALVTVPVMARWAEARTEAFGNYVPIYVPASTEVYDAGGPLPILDLTYVKQANQVDFMVCANLIGDGSWLLSYPEAGDPVYFHYSDYTWACLHTPTGIGGGTVGYPLQLWLAQGTGQTAHIATPNIFVSTAGIATPSLNGSK